MMRLSKIFGMTMILAAFMGATHAHAYNEETGADEYRVECPAFWYGPVVKRFALIRDWPQGAHRDVWTSRIDPGISVEIHTDSRGLASSIHLIDGAKGDQPR